MNKTKYIFLLILTWICAGLTAHAQLDSTKRAALGARLEEYFDNIKAEGAEIQKQECDFLIETCTDSLTRQFVAIQTYSHYLNSPVMGAESVAIHILDKWFFPGKVRMTNELDMLNARIYAEFNRQSLIGCKAPEIEMMHPDGSKARIFNSQDQKEFSVLYFYDADCAKCRLETPRLVEMLKDKDYPVRFHAVYTGDSKEKWEECRSRYFNDIQAEHLWDPEIDSDFQRKYGVIQTPRLFLISPDNTIIGRGLDTRALSLMLDNIFVEVKLEYGSEESAAMYDSIFESDGTAASEEEVSRIADYIESRSLPKGDTTLFRQMTGDLLYYLAGKREKGYREGLDMLVNRKILNRADIWKSADDSMKVVGFAGIMADLLGKCRPGSMISDIKVPGTLQTWKQVREGSFRLKQLKGNRNIIIFYTEGCHICDAEKAAAKVIAGKDRKTKILTINMDRIISENPDLASTLFDRFDLTTLPFIIETRKDGTITDRYSSLASGN